MATNDIRSSFKAIVCNRVNIVSDGTVSGVVIDTAGFGLGIMFTSVMAPLTDGFHVVSLFEDDDIGFGSPTLVPDENLIGDPPNFIGATFEGEVLRTFGAFSTKRFLRVTVTSSSITVPGRNDIAITAIQESENQPVNNI